MTKTPPQKHPAHTVSDDEVRDLLQQAGRRAEIPAEDFLAIKAHARAEWLQLVDARTSRRRWWRLLAPIPAAAAILVAVAVAWFWWRQSTPAAPPTVATIELLSGDAWVTPSTVVGNVGLEIGATIPAGAELVTGQKGDGTPSLISVRLAGGQSLRLSSGGRARVASAHEIELLAGAVYIDSDAAPKEIGVVVLTPFGRVTDIGTQFEVRLEDANDGLRVRVRRGSVALARDSEQHTAKRGEELAVSTDGSVDRAFYDPAGPDWAWVLNAAPTLEIQGLSLDRFLEWVSAETGLAVEFEDQDLAATAATIELHGSIDGLRPDEAALAVLPGTGLDHYIDSGTLWIGRARAER